MYIYIYIYIYLGPHILTSLGGRPKVALEQFVILVCRLSSCSCVTERLSCDYFVRWATEERFAQVISPFMFSHVWRPILIDRLPQLGTRTLRGPPLRRAFISVISIYNIFVCIHLYMYIIIYAYIYLFYLYVSDILFCPVGGYRPSSTGHLGTLSFMLPMWELPTGL